MYPIWNLIVMIMNYSDEDDYYFPSGEYSDDGDNGGCREASTPRIVNPRPDIRVAGPTDQQS